MKIDKTNGDVKYNDENHVYWNENGNYTSVTTLLGFYKSKFDAHFWASYKALEFLTEERFIEVKHRLLNTKVFDLNILKTFNIDEKTFSNKRSEILKSYDDEREKSCDRGTKIHAEFENKFYKSETHKMKDYGMSGTFKCIPHYYELNLEKGIYPEYLISLMYKDGKLKVAGQIDLLIKDGNDITIIDYKSNKKIDHKSYYNKNTKKYQCLKYPLNNLHDCNLIHYTLQLSLYAYLLQLINPEFKIKELKLIHVDHEDKTTEIVVDYLKEDIIRVLNHYKQQCLIQSELEKDTPIMY